MLKWVYDKQISHQTVNEGLFMDSDMDSSSEDRSTESSTDSSDDDDKLEATQICGVRLQLPQGLCEHKDIFDEFFSPNAWNSLSSAHKQHLKNYLPTFPVNDDHEKTITLQRLFNKEVFKFTSPLEQFHEHLKAGHYRPDIAKMRNAIKKAEMKELKFRHNLYRERLKREVLESRNKLLNLAKSLPPGVDPKMEKLGQNTQSYFNPIGFRTKRRYFNELAGIKEHFEEQGFSSDENYPEGPIPSLSRKHRRHLNTIKSSINTQTGMSAFVPSTTRLDLEKLITPNYNPFYVTEDMYRNLLVTHKRKRTEDPSNEEYDTSDITIFKIINRTDLASFKKLNVSIKPHSEIKSLKKKHKKEVMPISRSPELVNVNKNNLLVGHSSHSEIDSDSDPLFDSKPKNKKVPSSKPSKKENKTEIPDSYSTPAPSLGDVKTCTDVKSFGKVTPATLSDLDGIDMMNLPIDLEDSNIDILEFDGRSGVIQDTHVNFLCLIRDIICSTPDHRMSMAVLEDHLHVWHENPISPLNDWYSLSNNWIALLPLAIDFLSGNCSEQPDDFVPYIEYKIKIDMYQWIGAGRDSDTLLIPLCQFWLDHRADMKPSLISKERDKDIELSDRSHTPPPPRCPTTWSIRKASSEEVKSFQEQERRRYNNPQKAFTFKCNGYESVVGPIKGAYNHQNTSSTKARGHSILTAERPNYVTILTLVRDASARLPNGEGTRSDICELLKSSQYISPKVPESALQSVVSGALDRMHTQFDPCVKFDSKRKVWIYLHRNRSEGDFERIHQRYQGLTKTPKKSIKPKQKHEKTIKITENIKSEATLESIPSPKLAKLLEQPIEKKKPLVKHIALAASTSVEKVKGELQPLTSSVAKYPKSNKITKGLSPNQGGKSQLLPSVAIQKPIEQQKIQLSQQVLEVATPKITMQHKQNTAELKVQAKIAQQPPILQAVTHVQKGVTILKSANLGNIATPTLTPASIVQTNTPTISVPETHVEEKVVQIGIQTKVQPRLTAAQQQQILQTLKQKIVPVNQILPNTQYRAVAKSRVAGVQLQKQVVASGSLVEQAKLTPTDVGTNKQIITSQTPLVAKVLTNAAGQVISVESLLAHQKQHGSLPQGTTLRISGTKGGPANLIQLTTPSLTPSSVTQLTGTTNVSGSNQPKVISATEIIAPPTTKAVIKTATKVVPRIAQQLVSAKLIAQNVAGHKVVQPKVLVAAQNQVKGSATVKNISGAKTIGINVAANTGTIRMVNATNINLAQISGKPVLISSKGVPFQSIQGQNIILQTESNTGNQGIVLSNTSKAISNNQSSNTVNISNQQHAQVILSPSLKVQQSPRLVLSSAVKPTAQTNSSNQLVLGGQAVRVHTAGTSTPHRVLVAGQNPGQIITQQILLPVGFQGAPFNIKTLQGLKVVPITHAQGKGLQGRPVFARIMSPSNIVRVTQASETLDIGNLSNSPAE